MDTALTDLAALGGFSSTGDWIYGECEGFPFCIGESGGLYVIQWGVSNQQKALRPIRRASNLWKKQSPYVCTSLTYAIDEKTVMVKLQTTGMSDLETDLLRLLQACAEALTSADIMPACFSCGKGSEPYSFYKWGERPIAFCDSCAERKRESHRSGRDQTDKSVFRGTIGAMLGGIIGIIPWLIVSRFGFIVAICGFVIVYCAQKGYHMLGGKRGKVEGVVLIIVTLLCVLLATFISLSIDVALLFRESGYVFSLLEIAAFVWYALISMPTEMSDVWINLAMSLLFAFWGAHRLLASSLRSGDDLLPVVDLPEQAL